jgi:hypothetical protein
MVDPLGEVLIMLFPDGLRPLLAPAVAPPAFVLPDTPAPELPAVFPLMPVVVPLEVDAPELPVAPPAEPPLCAKAAVPVSNNAVANPTVASLIGLSCLRVRDKRLREHLFPPLARMWKVRHIA